jgi:hypothetical protein
MVVLGPMMMARKHTTHIASVVMYFGNILVSAETRCSNMTSIPNWRHTFVRCFVCDENVQDKEVIAIANIAQVFNAHTSFVGSGGGDSVTVGHVRKRANYFHKKCFSKVCTDEKLLESLQDSQMTEEDWKYLNKLAGVK